MGPRVSYEKRPAVHLVSRARLTQWNDDGREDLDACYFLLKK